MDTVLAVGAAGPFAGLVVPELARRGVRVRGLVHDPGKADAVRAAGAAEVAIGDLADSTSLDAALKGVDGVFYLAPATLPNEAEVGRRVVAAAKAAGVRRFVFSSLIDPILDAIPHHVAKAPVEAAIVESGMAYALLHPALFFQNLAEGWSRTVATGVHAEPWSNGTRFSRVDYRDVAEVAAIALTEDRLDYGTYELCAEGWLDRPEVAALMSEVAGKPIRAVRADPASVPNVPDTIRAMFAWYDRHDLRGNALTLRAILGREPRTLRTYLEELNGTPRP